MNAFQVETTDTTAQVQLAGEVTIEDARSLQIALRTALLRPRELVIDTTALTRIDAAVLQVLLAGARAASARTVPEPAAAWSSALQRYALAAAFAEN